MGNSNFRGDSGQKDGLFNSNGEADDYGTSETRTKTTETGNMSALGTDIGPKQIISNDQDSDSSVDYMRTHRTLSDAAYETPATSGIPGAVFNFTNSMFVSQISN